MTTPEVSADLDHVRDAPKETGRVELIVRRPAVEEREVVEEAELDPTEGLVGDCWRTRGSSSMPDGSANPDAQLTLMNARAAALVAGDREGWHRAGDQLFVDFDLSRENVPAGTRLELVTAVIEVTALPHTGCGKFLRRFGIEAQKLVNSSEGRELNLRGINAKVVRAGTVRVGDEIRRAHS
ncbi:MAG: MOSC domain-containing protein [Thermoleophilaceae bacterium]